jgi:FkbM family methyltransferase
MPGFVRSIGETVGRRADPIVRATMSALPRPIRASFRRAKQRAVRARFQRRVVQHTYGGVPLKVTIADPIGAAWYEAGWSSIPEIDLLRTRGRLRRGSNVFNIGAHQAVVALVLAHHVAPEGRVVAVEAGRHDVEIAERNRELNFVRNLRILHAAGIDHEGMVTFDEWAGHVPDDPRLATDPVRVPAVSLDSLARKYGPPDVVFIDVEGAEGLILRGATSVLRRQPDFFVEVHVGCGLERLGSSSKEVLSCFPPSDYDLYVAVPSTGRVAEFVAFHANQIPPEERFFLVCLARQADQARTSSRTASIRS